MHGTKRGGTRIFSKQLDIQIWSSGTGSGLKFESEVISVEMVLKALRLCESSEGVSDSVEDVRQVSSSGRGQDEEKKPARQSAQEWPVRKEHGVIKLGEKAF